MLTATQLRDRIAEFQATCDDEEYTDAGEAHELLADTRMFLEAQMREGAADFRNMPADAKPRARGAGASSTGCDDQHTTARRL